MADEDATADTGDVVGTTLPDGLTDTDVGNAERLLKVAGGEIRYVNKWQKWLVYIDGVWELDPGAVMVVEKAKRVPRYLYKLAGQATLDSRDREPIFKWAKKSESAGALTAMVRLAAGLPGIIVHHNELENQPELLNVANGTVDLRTSTLQKWNPEHLLVKKAPVQFDPEATCPLWMKCLERWQPDPTMRAYLQICAGMAATGYLVEEFHVHHGGGANGKGKFFSLIADVLGPYAVVPDKSLLVLQRHEPHDTVKAHLFRARVAIGDETAEGDKLNEEKVKQLTGGDKIKARRMREDEWEFEPSHLLVIRTNHIPRVRSADEAMRRRYRLIPWNVTIPSSERDPRLQNKLRKEAAGILNWILEGAKLWFEYGMQMPQAAQVTEATNEMFRSADPTGYFLSIATTEGGDKFTTTRELHEAYLAWITNPKLDEPPKEITLDEMGRYIRDRGFRKSRGGAESNGQVFWKGIALTDAYQQHVEYVRQTEPHRLTPSATSYGVSLPNWNPSGNGSTP